MPFGLGRLGLDPLDAAAQVGRVLIAGEDGHLPLAVQQLGELLHDLLTDAEVVDAVVGEALRLRRVAVEGHDRHAARHRVVDGAGQLAGVRAGDEDGVGPFVHRLGDPLRLNLAVLDRRSQPDDLDGDADLGREIAGRRLGAAPGREEDRVGRALGDHRDPDRLLRRMRRLGRGRSRRRRLTGRLVTASDGQRRQHRCESPMARTARATPTNRAFLISPCCPLPPICAPQTWRSLDREPPRRQWHIQ